MIVGIDIGGSTTDAVILENGSIRVVTIEANDPVAAAAGALGKIVGDAGISLSDIESVAATGAGSRALGDQLFGRPVVKVNEFTAIGVGGTTLAHKDRALVVSLGTGTAMVSVNQAEIRHVSGTGVGGGTLLGLAKHMLGVSGLDTLETMAGRGDLHLTGDQLSAEPCAFTERGLNHKHTAREIGRVQLGPERVFVLHPLEAFRRGTC